MISPKICHCIHPFFRNYGPVSTPSSYSIGYSCKKDTVSSYFTKYTLCTGRTSLSSTGPIIYLAACCFWEAQGDLSGDAGCADLSLHQHGWLLIATPFSPSPTTPTPTPSSRRPPLCHLIYNRTYCEDCGRCVYLCGEHHDCYCGKPWSHQWSVTVSL